MAFVSENYSVDEIPVLLPFQVCVTSGIVGNIELELIVTLDNIDGRAGKYLHHAYKDTYYYVCACINCFIIHFNYSC